MSKIYVKTTCQIASYGMKKPKTSGDALTTKSAKHLRFNASDIGLIKGKEVISSPKEVDISRPKTTESFVGITTYEAAFRFLNNWDTSNKTPDYVERASAYDEQKKLLNQTLDFKGLEGKAKMDYYNRIKAFCFKYYKVNITVIIVSDDETRRVTESRTHYRLNRYTQSDIMRAIGDYSPVAGINVPEQEAQAESEV